MIQTGSRSSLFALYASAGVWNLCMGMLHVLLPLYAASLGYSVFKISTIVALPFIVDIWIRFFCAAIADRYGERLILQMCYLMMVVSGLLITTAEGYTELLLAQVAANVSRSTFWVSVQSLATQMPGPDLGQRLGRVGACNYGGAMVGFSVGGVAAATLGFQGAFISLTTIASLAALIGYWLPHVEVKPVDRTVWQITRGIADFLRYRSVWLAITISYAAALPPTLAQSIYPLYLIHLNYATQWIGIVVAVRGIGTILVSLGLGRLITSTRQELLYALGMAALGLFLIATAVTVHPLWMSLWLIGLGAAGGMMDLLCQVRATELSRAGDRSVAIASTGLGWNLSPLLTPLVVGWLAQNQGFRAAFIAAAMLFLGAAVGTKVWHRLVKA